MIISIIILAASVAIVFMLKDKFMGMGAPIRNGIIGTASLVIATILTMEFFIYLDQRINAFLEAIDKIHIIFVILFFAGLVYVSWLALSLFLELSLEDIIKIFKDAWDKVKEAGKGGWFNVKGWWKERKAKKLTEKEGKSERKPDENKGI